MNKYAAEKIAQEYYQLGISLALQNAGVGMSKTASKSKALLAGLVGGMGGAAALPSIKGLGQDAAKYLREAYSTMRAPQIMENADLARFAENLRQGNVPSSFTQSLAAGENLNAAAAREAFAMAEANAALKAMQEANFTGMGGDAVRGLGNFMQGQKIPSMLEEGLNLSLK
jgi:hypothetical protein